MQIIKGAERGAKHINRVIAGIGGRDSDFFMLDKALVMFGGRRQLSNEPSAPVLSITNEAGVTCSAGETVQTGQTPEVAASDDDDDGGDSDGEPARPYPHPTSPTPSKTPKRKPSQPPALFTFEHLKQYTDLNRTRIYRLIKQGQFPPPIKIGKSSRWQRCQIDAWIQEQAQAHPAKATHTPKHFASLQAKAALAGYQLTQTASGYMLSRVTHSRHCADIESIKALLQNAGIVL